MTLYIDGFTAIGTPEEICDFIKSYKNINVVDPNVISNSINDIPSYVIKPLYITPPIDPNKWTITCKEGYENFSFKDIKDSNESSAINNI